MKKIRLYSLLVLIFLSLLLCLSLSACGSKNAGITDDGLIWFKSEDGIHIAGYFGTTEDLVIPASIQNTPVVAIGNYTFRNNAMLKTITIPDSVTSIGDSAFSGCSALESITLPFVGGSKSATTTDSSTVFGYIFGTSSYTGGVATKQYYSSSGSTYYIPATLKSVTITGDNIPNGAFYGCSGLTNVTIGNGMTTIGDSAFDNCDGLTSIVIPDSVTTIGNNAFRSCDGLTSITLGNSVTTIGDWAFSWCSNLTSITIPNSLTTISDSAFYGCSKLSAVYMTDIGAWCSIHFANFRSNPLYYAKNLYLNGELVSDMVIPDSVTSIGDYAFSHCFNLTSITISDSITSIGDYAFSDCSGLTSIVIPDSVTTIGDSAFSHCFNLTSIVIPDSVTSIGNSAFDNCDGLTSIVIPDSVTSIGDWAFAYCHNLKNVYYTGTAEQWANIQIAVNNASLVSATVYYNYVPEE